MACHNTPRAPLSVHEADGPVRVAGLIFVGKQIHWSRFIEEMTMDVVRRIQLQGRIRSYAWEKYQMKLARTLLLVLALFVAFGILACGASENAASTPGKPEA